MTKEQLIEELESLNWRIKELQAEYDMYFSQYSDIVEAEELIEQDNNK
jgi:hypothetical protein